MTFADRIFRPFENFIKPLDLPITPLPDQGPVQLIWHFAKLFRGVLVAVSALSIVSGFIRLAVVWVLAFVVDGVVADGASLFISENLVFLIGFALLLMVIDPLISFIDDCYNFQTVSTLLPAAMSWQSHKAVENQDVSFFEDLYAGQVAAKIAQVSGSVQSQLMMAVQRIPQFLIQFVGSLGLLVVLAWQLAIPVVCWMLINILIAVIATPWLIKKSAKVAAASSRATGVMTDVYSNISIVKAFSAEAAESDGIRQVLGETIDTNHQINRLSIFTYTAVRISNALLGVSIFVIGMWGLLGEFVSMGDFVAAVTISTGLTRMAFSFIGLGMGISRSYGTIRDAMPVMTSKPKLSDKPNAVPFNLISGSIEFDDVSYSYLNDTKSDKTKPDSADETNEGKNIEDKNSTDQKPVIQKMNLTVAPGEKVGLVGLSGAGKSTIISLLLRLRDVNSGSVKVDGQDVRDVQQNSLRDEIGVITQDVFLLNRSIRDNVGYGATSVTDEEINQALRMAKALEFVEDLKDKENRTGLDAHVGDKGVKLSGGQRQRLAIARVILKDAKILLLDEATSALDSEAETEIQQNLKELMSDKTALVVAHRLSTISEMDRLVVLDKGKIVEQGTHDELITRSGLYARLWTKQSGGFIATK